RDRLYRAFNTGVVEEDVDAARLAANVTDIAAYGVFVCNVGFAGYYIGPWRKLGAQAVQRIGVPIDRCDPCPAGSHESDGSRADLTARAGDQGDLTVEPIAVEHAPPSESRTGGPPAGSRYRARSSHRADRRDKERSPWQAAARSSGTARSNHPRCTWPCAIPPL